MWRRNHWFRWSTRLVLNSLRAQPLCTGHPSLLLPSGSQRFFGGEWRLFYSSALVRWCDENNFTPTSHLLSDYSIRSFSWTSGYPAKTTFSHLSYIAVWPPAPGSHWQDANRSNVGRFQTRRAHLLILICLSLGWDVARQSHCLTKIQESHALRTFRITK